MADSASQNYFTANVLTNTGAALIVITSATVITRFSIRIWKRKPFQVEDFLVALAWASFLALTVSYIVVTPPMYHLYAVTGGEAAPYPEMMDDAMLIIKVFFYNTMLLWATLWAVKFSLLALYRRLMTGLRLCATPRDVKAQIASLYYAFAVDVLTDLLSMEQILYSILSNSNAKTAAVMALPIRLIWNLQMPRAEKLGIGALFCSGFICITVAILRVVQIGVKANNSTPSSSWLALWAEVEAAIAVFIGCCPAFAAFYRTKRNTSRGYSKPKDTSNRSGPSAHSHSSNNGRRDDEVAAGVALQCMTACTSGGSSSSSRDGNRSPRKSNGGAGKSASTYWDEANSSQEELAPGAGKSGIYVTRSIRFRKHCEQIEV
ncbi:hypothetical protein SLS56_002819 [Neofusicoccum ribis]|uniref:Rhodopsin domain-containing protein n=1 Tax=Neofusicoccum ribis TaxID=45134 RepID=A0ABR3T2Y0_9PEZI